MDSKYTFLFLCNATIKLSCPKVCGPGGVDLKREVFRAVISIGMERMRRRLMSSLPLFVLCFTILQATAAMACVICIPYPESTNADALLESKIVVLAREDPAKPFFLEIVEVLKGSSGDTSTGVFLPSLVRRKLNIDSTGGIILVRRQAASQWEWLSYATTAYQAFARQVLANKSNWRGETGQQLRIAFFTERLNDKDTTIREQAFLEIGRAPYGSIKKAAHMVPVEHVRETLANWQLIEWHSLYILMLGQSQQESDRAYIRKRFESASFNLSAWTTAYIETHPRVAIEMIEDSYFKNEGRPRKELEEVLLALSVIAGEEMQNPFGRNTSLRRRISIAYESLLEHHPEMAGWVARELVQWRRQALVERLTNIRREYANLDSASAFAIDLYLGQAARFSVFAPSE